MSIESADSGRNSKLDMLLSLLDENNGTEYSTILLTRFDLLFEHSLSESMCLNRSTINAWSADGPFQMDDNFLLFPGFLLPTVIQTFKAHQSANLSILEQFLPVHYNCSNDCLREVETDVVDMSKHWGHTMVLYFDFFLSQQHRKMQYLHNKGTKPLFVRRMIPCLVCSAASKQEALQAVSGGADLPKISHFVGSDWYHAWSAVPHIGIALERISSSFVGSDWTSEHCRQVFNCVEFATSDAAKAQLLRTLNAEGWRWNHHQFGGGDDLKQRGVRREV